MPTPPLLPSASNPIRTLVISEQPLVLIELRHFFDLLPDITLIAKLTDGRTLRGSASGLKPDVVLFDATASNGGSLALLAQLKADCPQLPVVFLSLQNSRTYAQQAFKAGASGYVVGMAGEVHIANAIREVYSGGRYCCPCIRGLLSGSAAQSLPDVAGNYHEMDHEKQENPTRK